MTARLLEGRPVAEAIWRDVSTRAATFADGHGRPPTLGLVAGADEAAAAYARQIERQFGRRGLRVQTVSSDAARFNDAVAGLSADRDVDGILLLTPFPDGVDGDQAVRRLDPAKDVDGQHPTNLGRLAQRRAAFAPATALGGLRLLQHYEIPLRGATITVVGRSPVVGMPLALLLIDADASVTVAHSRSRDLAAITRHADIVCVAAGRAGLIGRQHVRPGAVVLDFGTNPTPAGDLVGDVDPSVLEIAGAMTPVPGGTGPTTVAVLAQATVAAAEQQRGD